VPELITKCLLNKQFAKLDEDDITAPIAYQLQFIDVRYLLSIAGGKTEFIYNALAKTLALVA
jgi:hypothetical protein